HRARGPLRPQEPDSRALRHRHRRRRATARPEGALRRVSDGKLQQRQALGTARTDGAGRFELIRKLRATTYVAAYINFYRTSRCAAAIGPAPCVGATVTPPPNAYVRAVVRR